MPYSLYTTCEFCGRRNGEGQCGCAGEARAMEEYWYNQRRTELEQAISAAREAGDEAEFQALCAQLDDLMNDPEDEPDYRDDYRDDYREPDEPDYGPEDCDREADRYFGTWR